MTVLPPDASAAPPAQARRTLAAIDVGSSAARLSVAHATRTVPPKQVAFSRYPVRLGTAAFSQTGNHVIDADSVVLLMRAADSMRATMQRWAVDDVVAVGTSALREAVNGSEVAEALGRRLGVKMLVITGDEEATMSRLALERASAQAKLTPPVVYIDLGGGSLELAGAGGTPAASLPLGTVRLLSQMPELNRPIGAEKLALCALKVREQLVAGLASSAFGDVGRWAHAALVGTGGNLQALAKHCPAPTEQGPAVDLLALRPLLVEVAAMPLATRAHRYQLRPDRTDLMLPALLFAAALADIFATDQLLVPGAGLRDTLLRTMWLAWAKGDEASPLLPSRL